MNKLFSKYLKIVLPLLLIMLVSGAMAQTRKGEKLVNEGRYEDAIKPLKRAFEGNLEDRKAGLLLIESYYMLQRYQDALDAAELMDIERSVNEKEMVLYADVLIANNDFSRAYVNLTRMLGEGGAKVQGYKWLNKAGNLLQWDSVPSESTVTEIQGLNTVYNEYAPYVTEDGLMYIADHLTVQVLYPSAFTNQSLHLLFTSPKGTNGKFGRAKMLLRGREYYYHDGPIEERPNANIYAVTLREIDGLLYDLKMNIFFSKLTGAEDDLIPFKYNGTFNTGHPTFTDDGNRMYFASDRPGGYGQLDLWYTDWVDGEWSPPKNAGPGINSPSNELYPKICNDRLFFSSDRRDQGYGGLDLYYVSLLTSNDHPYNLRAPINSAYDDFAVDFADKKTGYFSSNRTTGFGGDDIYEMYFQPRTTVLDTLTFAMEDMSGTKKTLRIFDSSGNEMVGINNSDKTTTVSGLLTRELYTIKADSVFDASYTLVAYDSKGVKVQEFASDLSTFNIEFLEQEEFDMNKQENLDESELFDLFGTVVSNETQDFKNVSVVLEDYSGTILDEAKTDSTGKFLLKRLMWDKPYNLTAKGTTGEVEIDVLGQTGAPITTLQRNQGENNFAYTRSRPEADWMMASELVISDVFGIVPSANLSSDEHPELWALGDSLIRICEVDEDGLIAMGSLTTGHSYELVFENSRFDLSDKMLIIDGSGDTTQTVRPHGASGFVFELLPPTINKTIDERYFQPATTFLDTLTFAMEDMSGTKKTLRIFDSSGNEMVGINNSDETMTVSGLLTREMYTIKVDSVFDGSYILVAYDSKGVKVQEFASDFSTFNIEFLEQEEFALNKQDNADESDLFDLLGAVVSNEIEDFTNVSVVIEDNFGTALNEVQTDSTGKFLFKGLSWDESYNLTAKGTTGEVEIDALGQTGAPITTLKRNPGRNSFAYTRSRPEAAWMTSTDLVIPVVFGIVPSANLSSDDDPEIWALGDSLIRVCEVDEDGFIEMGSLTTGHAYELIFKNSSFDLSNKLVIIDGSGDTTQTVRPDGTSAFVFELMPPSIKRTSDEVNLAQNKPQLKAGESKTEELVNLRGVSAELKKDDQIRLYNSSNMFLTETYAKEGGFSLNQVPLDSIYFIQADIRDALKMTSTYHGFEKAGKLKSKGLWKFDFTEVEEAEKTITLSNIYYRFDSHTLSPESKESLDNLHGFLRQNPNQKIKVLSHTDSRGPRAYNERLSNLRAREVVRDLIRRGIDPDRLSYEGRGESQLVNECKDGTYCTNDEHAKNRRTEFALIKN
jgi:outer membrane protein OmpA-like peptidoglycan-associated protein/tetratricopeptide (TPR) repeat protein